MDADDHFRALERLYQAAPLINKLFPSKLSVSEGRADIELEVEERFFHAAGAMHGAVGFKLLDNAAFFAASSLEASSFLHTASFTCYFLRPVSSGVIHARGRIVSQTRSQFIGESVVADPSGREICRGHGVFARSALALADVSGYAPQ